MRVIVWLLDGELANHGKIQLSPFAKVALLNEYWADIVRSSACDIKLLQHEQMLSSMLVTETCLTIDRDHLAAEQEHLVAKGVCTFTIAI